MSKKTWSIILVIVLIAAAAVGIYYATKKPEPKPAPEATATVEPTKEEKTDEPAKEEKKEPAKEEKTEPAKEEKTDEPAKEEKKEKSKAEDAYTVRWVSLGGGQPENYDSWIKKFNEYAMEKIGVKLEVEVLSWGAYGEKRSAMINGGEYFDIVFTDGGSYASDLDKGVLLDITELLPKYAPKLKETLPEAMWNAATVNGKLYAVPTMKDSSLTQYFVWDPAVVEATGMDVSGLKTLADLEPVLIKMKENGVEIPFEINRAGVYQILDVYDKLALEIPVFGIRYDDTERKVVSVFEQQEIQDQLALMNKYMKDGLVNAGASTSDNTADYRPFYIAQGWPNAWKVSKSDVVCLSYPFVGPIFSNVTVRGSMNGIYAGCKNPEATLKMLELVNTDQKARDMLCYGEEGVNFEYVEEDGKTFAKPNPDKGWVWARYAQGNHFILTPEISNPNMLKDIEEMNAQATPSVALGFDPKVDEFVSELAAMKAIYTKYESEMMTGTQLPEEIVPKMMQELRAAGFDEVQKSLQEQVDAHFAK